MLPPQTILRYSVIKKLFGFLIAVFLVVAAYILWQAAHGALRVVAAVVVSLVGVFLLYMSLREIPGLRKPQLILSFEGITNAHGRVYAWGTIQNPRVEYTGGRYHSLLFTVQAHQPYQVKIDVSELTQSPDAIAQLVKAYREAGSLAQ